MENRRGQTSVEYILALTATVIMVAAIMVGGFRELELDLALASARIGGVEFASQHPYFSLGRIDYSVNDTDNTVTMRPRYTAYASSPVTEGQVADANNRSFWQVKEIYAPHAPVLGADYCQNGTYRRYCINASITPA